MMPEPRTPRLCVLIDADNVPASYAEAIFDEIAAWARPRSAAFMATGPHCA